MKLLCLLFGHDLNACDQEAEIYEDAIVLFQGNKKIGELPKGILWQAVSCTRCKYMALTAMTEEGLALFCGPDYTKLPLVGILKFNKK